MIGDPKITSFAPGKGCCVAFSRNDVGLWEREIVAASLQLDYGACVGLMTTRDSFLLVTCTTETQVRAILSTLPTP